MITVIFCHWRNSKKLYNVKSNFLEYGGVLLSLRGFLDNHDIPNCGPARPTNSLINVILSSDVKGVSNLYKCMYVHNNNIVGNICKKWFEKGNLIFASHEVRNSFNRTNSIIDIYLRYIQLRVLHYRFLQMMSLKRYMVCQTVTFVLCAR